jgi:hypothetical protein
MDTQLLTLKKSNINDTKEPRDAHKNTPKGEITENFREKILDVVNQDALKKFEDTKSKECEKTQKQIN